MAQLPTAAPSRTSSTSQTAADLSKINASPNLPFSVIAGDHENATWTKYVPEVFGLRQAIRKSPYRWCTRESTMWGIASGCVMGLHRWRMGSSPAWAVHSAFFTTLLVMVPSYYYCVQDRDRYHEIIETMMNYNQWEYREQLPERPEMPQNDPFFELVPNDDETNDDNNNDKHNA